MSDVEMKREEEPESQQVRLTDMEHCEELGRMVERLRGLQALIEGGLNLDAGLPCDSIVNGVHRLVDDVCESMEACADAFHAARQGSMARERREEAVRVLGEEAVKMAEERRLRLEEERQ
jgi:hypothetical protein